MITTTQQVLPIAPGTWQIDPIHSSIEFLVVDTHSRFTTVKGRFTDFEGTLTTAQDLAAWQASGVIRPASLTTAQDQRDTHLRSADFLNVTLFPEIRFESERFEQLTGNTLRVTGHLVMQGQAQPIAVEITVLGQGSTEEGAQRVVLSGAGKLSFGPMTVQITMHMSAVKGA